MSNQTLTSVAIDVVGRYDQAGKQLVRAYRAGTVRVVGAVNERFAAAVNARSLPLVNAAVKSSLITAEQQIAGLVATGLGLGATGADTTIDQLARGVKGGIERISGTTARFETAFDTSAMDAVGVLAMPVAQVSLEIANIVARGSKRLSERVAGTNGAVVAVPAKAAKKRVARTARRA